MGGLSEELSERTSHWVSGRPGQKTAICGSTGRVGRHHARIGWHKPDHNHRWVSLLGKRQGFGSKARGNTRWVQGHCARQDGLYVKLCIPDKIMLTVVHIQALVYSSTPNRLGVEPNTEAWIWTTVKKQDSKKSHILTSWLLIGDDLGIIGSTYESGCPTLLMCTVPNKTHINPYAIWRQPPCIWRCLPTIVLSRIQSLPAIVVSRCQV